MINSTRAMIASLKTACDMFEVDTGLYPTGQRGRIFTLYIVDWRGVI
jgi:hypothetical protein